VVRAQLVDEAGTAVQNVEQRQPIGLDVLIEAKRELTSPVFVLHVVNADGTAVFALQRTLDASQSDRVAPGQRVQISGRVENRLVPGRYYLDLWVARGAQEGELGIQSMRALEFVVYGTATRVGLVSMDADVEAVIADPGSDG
jgi:hypothetical protein